MKAAVVSSFQAPPRYQDVPEPAGPAEQVVNVLASALHPRVRSQANGSHYTSTEDLPLVPGIDGVGRRADGSLVYFVLPHTRHGAMAERVAIDPRRAVPLPAGTDPVLVAAAMNPAMSSWLALRHRTAFVAGQEVLVLGATGNAGRMAVEMARHLGAAHVTVVGRGAARLAQLTELGADRVVDLAGDPRTADEDLAAAGADVDVVLDYLWGEPTARALRAIVPARRDDARLLTWVQIGSVAGPESRIPSAALRATRLQLVGSGQGSVSPRTIVGALPDLASLIDAGTFTTNARTVPLADVEAAWQEAPGSAERLVLVP